MSDIPPNPTKLTAWRNVCTDMRTAVTNWRDINAKDLIAFNAMLVKNNIKAIPTASPSLPIPVCTAPVAAPTGRGGR
jgi:hypothetical protein